MNLTNPYVIAMAGIILLALLFWPQRGLLSRLRRSRQYEQRIQIEDTLKHIHGCEMESQRATVESIAGVLQTSTNNVSDLLAKMETAGLLRYEEGQLKLTPKGERSALHILRAHRLWERYLADETGFEEAEWHDQAEKREHFLSAEEVDLLSEQLGHPTHDPHGDPIPDAMGEFVSHGGKPLPGFEPGQRLRIVHIEDEPSTIYAQLVAEGIYPGMQVQIIEKTHERIRFWAEADEHVLAPIVAHNISVIPEPEAISDGEGFPCKSLDCLDLGESGKVLGISPACRGAERRRLLDLGVLRGATVKAEYRSPSGDPTAYRIRDALIALRKEQAEYIFIESEPEVSHERI
jgi:DtxR family transcriptional regulator, Mn-dependent transcriptional regulator